MRVDLERKKLLFKTKNTNKQSASNSGRRGDEQHNTVEGGRMHSGDAKVANLVGEHLKKSTKKKK
jgi:hypothetical protein